MLKFRDEKDRLALIIEAERPDLLHVAVEDYPEEVTEIFLKTQRQRAKKLVDFRQSQTTSKQWRQNRWKMMRGIKNFHKSVKGKQFHRALGRFLATRIFDSDRLKSMTSLRAEALKSVSSMRTHLYIESEYYMSIEEQIDFIIFLEYAIPTLSRVEIKLFEEDIDEINQEELELLIRLVENKEFIKGMAALDVPESVVGNFNCALGSDDTDSLFYFTESLGYPPQEEEAEEEDTTET